MFSKQLILIEYFKVFTENGCLICLQHRYHQRPGFFLSASCTERETRPVSPVQVGYDFSDTWQMVPQERGHPAFLKGSISQFLGKFCFQFGIQRPSPGDHPGQAVNQSPALQRTSPARPQSSTSCSGRDHSPPSSNMVFSIHHTSEKR